MDPCDCQRLERFHQSGDQAAFAAVVTQYLPLVHAVALRITSNAAQAEDVSQTVFVKLAGKSLAGLPQAPLSVWLHGEARSQALRLLRSEQRRRRREHLAASMHAMIPSDLSTSWERISPLIDEVISQLPTREREVILARFFEGRSHRNVAAALGLSEDAARMRVNRGLEKLRELLARRGVTTTSAALASALPGHAFSAATIPPGLALSITTACGVLAVPTSTTFASFLLMASTKKLFVGAGFLILAGIAGMALHRSHGETVANPGQGNPGIPGSADPAPSTPAESRKTVREEVRAKSNRRARGVAFANRILEPFIKLNEHDSMALDLLALRDEVNSFEIEEVEAAAETIIGETRFNRDIFRIGIAGSILQIWLEQHQKTDSEATALMLDFLDQKAPALMKQGLAHELCDPVLVELAKTDGPLAVRWFAERPQFWKSTGPTDEFRGELLTSMAKDPEEALQQLEILKPTNFKLMGRRLASASVEKAKLPKLIEAFRHQQERMEDRPEESAQLREGMLAGLVKSSSFLNPGDLHDWFTGDDLSTEEQKTILRKVELFGNTREIDNWMKVFSGRLDEAEIGKKIAEVMPWWQKNQPGAQEAWIEALSEGPLKEAAVKSYIVNIPDPEKAKRMSQKLPEGALRREMDEAIAAKPVAGK